MNSRAPLLLATALLSAAMVAEARCADMQGASTAVQDEASADAYARMSRGVSLGVAVMWSEGLLLGEDTRTYVVPTIAYEGERVFFRGINGGVHLLQRDGFELDAIVAVRLDGWDAEDLDATRLAAVGIDRALLSDRDAGLDAGLELAWTGRAGKISLSAKGDIINASGGVEVALDYRSAFRVGPGLLTPHVGVSHWSGGLSDYYYGTLPEEEKRGVPRYRPGSAVVPEVGLGYLQRLRDRWLFVAAVDYRWLPSSIVDSPLVDDDSGGVPSVFFGFSRSFGGQPR
ncbi:outer membrane protein [Luteimonas cucumeris]|uniref:Outer membrane protein n=1 Tax=Luteimonas cucumeris TaxID=985012 RepID=A0A562KY39_9GAMM|nr:MipA/OmpV family protein [Luteimonas cucumeris]TWI00331.1 outer membrane protein [Luteimonas cucumeris]